MTTTTTIPIPILGPASTANTITTGYLNNWASASSPVTEMDTLQVDGNTNIDGNLTIKGVDVARTLQAIQDRLAILVPNPKKLEKYAALQAAYDHYKLLEKMIGDE